MDGFGGAVPLASFPFPRGFDINNSDLQLLWAPLTPYYGPSTGPQGDNLQRQINVVEDLALQKGSHNVKLGLDFRQLSPIYGNPAYTQEVVFGDVPSSLMGNAAFAVTV